MRVENWILWRFLKTPFPRPFPINSAAGSTCRYIALVSKLAFKSYRFNFLWSANPLSHLCDKADKWRLCRCKKKQNVKLLHHLYEKKSCVQKRERTGVQGKDTALWRGRQFILEVRISFFLKFIVWKHRYGTEYALRLHLSDTDIRFSIHNPILTANTVFVWILKD